VKRNLSSISSDKIRGVLITRTAIKTLIPEDIVEKVVMFQFKDFRDAVDKHEQIEISGFVKFMTSPAKIRKKIERMEGALVSMDKKIKERPHEIPEKRLAVWDKMTETTKEIIAELKSKKGGYEIKRKRYIRGSVELPVCEEGDRGDSQAETGDL
jgi:nucleoid DNA-binding protein